MLETLTAILVQFNTWSEKSVITNIENTWECLFSIVITQEVIWNLYKEVKRKKKFLVLSENQPDYEGLNSWLMTTLQLKAFH